MSGHNFSRHRLPRFTVAELETLRELCLLLPSFMPSVLLRGHQVRVLHLQAGPTTPHLHFPRHVQTVYEGHLVLGGAGWYTIATPRQLAPGSLLLHAPGVEHEWETRAARLDWMIFWLHLDPAVPVPEPPAWPIEPAAVWEVALLLEDYRARRPGWQERAIARLTTLLSYLIGVAALPVIERRPPTAAQLLVDAVEMYLHQSLARPLQAPEIAAHVGISTRSLHRLYQSTLGQGVMTRLLTIRLVRAAQLLLTTELTVSAISDQVGINGASYFGKCFRKLFHVTPQQYRADGIELPLTLGPGDQTPPDAADATR
jgi:AraC-like DNA-binding protein